MTAVLDELGLTGWSPRSPACPRSARRRSWPRPATRGGSPPAGRWSSTPGWRRGRRCSGAYTGRTRLTGQGRPGAAAGRLARGLGSANVPTPSTPPGSPAPDQPGAQQADDRPGADRRSPPRCCGICTPSSPPASAWDPAIAPRHPADPARACRRLTTSDGGTSSWRPGRAPRGIETPP